VKEDEQDDNIVL